MFLRLAFCFSIVLFSITSAYSQARIRKAVFIIADGIAADVIEKNDLPALKSIAAKGSYTRLLVGGYKGTYTQTPTISAVGYNTVLTGTWVNKHNVYDNDITNPNYNYPTSFRLLKDRFPDRRIGIFSSWTDNREKLVGEGLEATGNIKFDYVADGFELDTVRLPHDKKSNYMHRIDELVADSAAACIRTQAPDLSWVYLEYTDDMGHAHGDSPEFLQAVQYTDSQVKRIYEAIQEREKNFREEWMIIVTTDHGRDSATGKHHGGQSAREKSGWMITDYKGLNERARLGVATHADIMPTILRFLEVAPPQQVDYEIDGVPLIGRLSLMNVQASYDSLSKRAEIIWHPLNPAETLKLYVTPTNNQVTGGADDYKLMSTVRNRAGRASVDLSGFGGSFFKLVLVGKYNTVNCWITPKGWVSPQKK